MADLEDLDLPIITDKYLKDFVRIHEYRLESRINEARAERRRRSMKNSSKSFIR